MIKKLLLFFTSFFALSLNRLDVHQPRTSTKIWYQQAVSLSQSFKSHHANLNIVSFCIRNPNRILEPLEFDLYETTTSGKLIRSLKFSAGNIDNQDCTRFQFKPLTDSQGKFYIASIKRLKPNPKKPSSLYIEAYNDQDYLEGTAFKDNQPLNLDFHFKTFYRQSLNQAIKEGTNRFITRLGRDKLFFIPYFLILTYLIKTLLSKDHD